MIEVQWGGASAVAGSVYPVDVAVEGVDRPGMLRDILEVFAKEKIHVLAVQTQALRGRASMTFTVEVSDSGRLHKVMAQVGELGGVRSARRR